MRGKKEKPMLSSRQKKRQIFLSLCIIGLCLPLLYLSFQRSGKYLSWEKAVTEALEARGYGAPEGFLLEKDGTVEVGYGGFFSYSKEQPDKWVVCKLTKSPTDAWLFTVHAIQDGPWWGANTIGGDYYNTELKAYYNENMEMMLGVCQNPDITEVTLRWGHWEVDETETAEIYVMDEAILPVDEKGFFYQEVDPSKAKVDIKTYPDGGWEERMRLIQTIYLEGRDKDGNILYRDGMDEAGRRFINNAEWN